jgi:hypothetical protein
VTLKNDAWLSALGKISKVDAVKSSELLPRLYRAYSKSKNIPPTLRFRELFDALQNQEPIQGEELPKITLGVVCHPKDFGLLELVVSNCVRYCQNPISEVIIVTTDDGFLELTKKFPEYKIKSEDSIFHKSLIPSLKSNIPNNKFGWVLQQLAKFWIVLNAENNSTLILDADTILLKKRAFIDSNGVQGLAYSYEYHSPYAQHFARFFQVPQDRSGHSFVTHHQLMQKSIVGEMFGPNGGLLGEWAGAANHDDFSPLCEYHCYGEFLTRNHPNLFKIMRWGNLPINRTKLDLILKKGGLELLETEFQDWNSVSAHSYL